VMLTSPQLPIEPAEEADEEPAMEPDGVLGTDLLAAVAADAAVVIVTGPFAGLIVCPIQRSRAYRTHFDTRPAAGALT